MKKPLRILHVVSALEGGGVEAMLMNVYKTLDRDEIQFDFITHSNSHMYAKEITELGGRIYHLRSMNEVGIVRYMYNLYCLLKKEKFYAVHSHILLQNGFILLIAKMAGVKIRVSHSHLTTYHRKITKILSPFPKLLIHFFSNKKVACGEEAGRHLYYSKKFMVIPNAINLEEYMYASDNKELVNIRDNESILIGNVARLSHQKNPFFILNLANYLKENFSKKFKIIMVGDGPLKDDIQKEIERLHLENYVYLLGNRNDIPSLLKSFDVFILPSLYEGLPVVLVEAQAAGIPIITSNKVTSEADMGLGLISYLSIDGMCLHNWAEEIKKAIHKSTLDNDLIKNTLSSRGYSVEASVNIFYKLYELY